MDIVQFHKYAAILTMLVIILFFGLIFAIPESAAEDRAAEKAVAQFSQGALETYLEVSEFIEEEVDKEVGGYYVWTGLLWLFALVIAIVSGSTAFFIHPKTISS